MIFDCDRVKAAAEKLGLSLKPRSAPMQRSCANHALMQIEDHLKIDPLCHCGKWNCYGSFRTFGSRLDHVEAVLRGRELMT